MAVYTHLSLEEIRTLIDTHYDVGACVSAEGIAEGIENSNYHVQCEARGQRISYILTVFEKRVSAEDMPFYMELMHHLAQQGISAPTPLPTRDDALFIAPAKSPVGKAASLVSFLPGSAVMQPSPEQCHAFGVTVATMHLAVAGFDGMRENALGAHRWRTFYQTMERACTMRYSEIALLVDASLDRIIQHWPSNLPAGIVHADLFPDNVFFTKGRHEVSGVIDWYFACHDSFAYDLAVVVNAWCFDAEHTFSQARYDALLEGYETVRPLSDEEKRAMPQLCAGAALRFLLTRTFDVLHHDEKALVTPKDPEEYVRKLTHFTARMEAL